MLVTIILSNGGTYTTDVLELKEENVKTMYADSPELLATAQMIQQLGAVSEAYRLIRYGRALRCVAGLVENRKMWDSLQKFPVVFNPDHVVTCIGGGVA